MEKIKITYVEILKRFFKPAFYEKKISLKVMVPSILGSLIGIIVVYLIKDITNEISNGLNSNTLFLLFILIGLILINYFILISTRNWTHAVLRPSYKKFMFGKYINKYIYLNNNESEKLGTGKLIALIERGMHSWVDLQVRFFLEILPNLTFVIFSFIFIGLINIYYLIVIFIFFIFIFVLTYILQNKTKKFREKRRDSNIGITRNFVKVLMAKFEILQNQKQDEEFQKISKALDYNISLNYRMRKLGIFIEISSKFLIDASKILLILMFGLGFGNNLINFGEFVSLMSILYILDQILTKSISLYVDYTKIFVDVEKLWDFFDSTPKIKGYNTGKTFIYKNGEIQIKDLNFGYTDDNLVFKNFNLNIIGKKITAIVGNSGSGKSTLVKLIAGYINTSFGDIIIDDQKISDISLISYYKNIGYLTQEPSVFDGTILNNLTYSTNGELTQIELEKILKLAKCEFIYDLPNGINTQIGERGIRLSGGQKQRLAIAKIFLKDPKIIILDEPTSSLDSFSEEKITKAMHNLFKDRTVIIIAHRLQTVKNANDIILLENGKITERGTHSQLVNLKGNYSKMLDLQSGF